MRSLSVTLVFALAAWCSAGSVQSPTGDLRPAVSADLAPHPSRSKTYNELWTFVFQFDQGTMLYLNFTRANLGPKDPVCGADVVLTDFKGKNLGVAREYPLRNFKFDPVQNSLAVHEFIHFDGIGTDTAHAHFATQKQGLDWRIHLSIFDAEAGVVWGDGQFKLGDDQVGMYLHIPKANVTATIAVNGDSLTLNGTAYMDHTYQTAFVPKLVNEGLRFVQHQGNMEVGQFFMATGEFGHKPLGYGIRGSESNRVLLKPDSFQVVSTNRAKKMNVPSHIRLVMQGNPPEADLNFERNQDKTQGSTLSEFSSFLRFTLKKLMGGEVFTFRGKGKVAGREGAAYSLFVVND